MQVGDFTLPATGYPVVHYCDHGDDIPYGARSVSLPTTLRRVRFPGLRYPVPVVIAGIRTVTRISAQYGYKLTGFYRFGLSALVAPSG